jgi:hypothetical protein
VGRHGALLGRGWAAGSPGGCGGAACRKQQGAGFGRPQAPKARPTAARLLPPTPPSLHYPHSLTRRPLPSRPPPHATKVTIISADMRTWSAPHAADILVSELLGSFGDNELSPECLDGAQRFLAPDGISIPRAHPAFLAPIPTPKGGGGGGGGGWGLERRGRSWVKPGALCCGPGGC